MPVSKGESTEAMRRDVPSTVARSEAKAVRIFGETLASAEEQYDDEGRARRTAFASLKRTHEKVGDHWQPKEDGHHGPSDAQAEQHGAAARDRPRPSAGGVDANATKAHLYDLAKKLGVHGRSSMTKPQLVAALQKANERETRNARG